MSSWILVTAVSLPLGILAIALLLGCRGFWERP